LDVDLWGGVEGACGAKEDAVDEGSACYANGYENYGCYEGADASFVFYESVQIHLVKHRKRGWRDFLKGK